MSNPLPSFPASGAPVFPRVAALLSGVRLAWLGLAAVFLWAAAAYLGVEKLTHERSFRLIEKERDAVSAVAAGIGSRTGSVLATLRSIPKVLARHPDIERALAAYGPDARRSVVPYAEFRRTLETDPRSWFR